MPKSNTTILEKLSVAFDSNIKKFDYTVQELTSKSKILLLGRYINSWNRTMSTQPFDSKENHMSSCVDKHNVSPMYAREAYICFLQSSSLKSPARSVRLQIVFWRADFPDSLCSLTVGRFVVGDLDDSRLRLSGVFNKV